jgi:hypothetical protein
VDLTSTVIRARRGFRRDVEALVKALPKGSLFTPLMRRIENVAVGVDTELGKELSLAPHLLYDENRIGYVLTFTRPDFIEAATQHVNLETDGGPLEYCTLPAPVVLDVALEIVDDERVAGLLVNAFDDSELVLKRHGFASITRGRRFRWSATFPTFPFSEDAGAVHRGLDGPPREMLDAIDVACRDAGCSNVR